MRRIYRAKFTATRLIVATARHKRIPIVTRDSNIIAYARQANVAVIAC
jgi:PIN domain nuclease of toxin-antitoxin system